MRTQNIQKRNIVGERVRNSRLNRTLKVTQEDLSNLLEAYGVTVTQASISKIEAGDRPVYDYDYELKAFGAALSVKIEWLLDKEEL
jgi:transcriptional regulator with XRE-family HTH domain